MATTEVTRRDVIDFFVASETKFSGQIEELEFLGRIWDLESMPSYDGRFSTAYGDIWQHRVNNNDWSDHYLLCNRLDLLTCEDSIFFAFLENCVHPLVRPSKEKVDGLVKVFNDCLGYDGYMLREPSQISGKPVYKVMPLRGVQGSVKNIIFAANGPKPEIVLIDSVNNDIQVMQNEEYCLIYDKPIIARGLLWVDLIDWWEEQQDTLFLDRKEQEIQLYNRLVASLASPPEKLLFHTYFKQFKKEFGDSLPALVPQVYLHYDTKLVGVLFPFRMYSVRVAIFSASSCSV